MSRTDESSMVIAAPRPRVFAALVDADALLAWLPPHGMTGRFEHFDARAGGGYRLVLTYSAGAGGKSDADHDVVDSRYLAIVSDERVVQAVDFVSGRPEFAGTMTMTWTLADAAGGTEVTIRAEGVPAGISADDHARGMVSSLDNLARHVTAPGAPG